MKTLYESILDNDFVDRVNKDVENSIDELYKNIFRCLTKPGKFERNGSKVKLLADTLIRSTNGQLTSAGITEVDGNGHKVDCVNPKELHVFKNCDIVGLYVENSTNIFDLHPNPQLKPYEYSIAQNLSLSNSVTISGDLICKSSSQRPSILKIYDFKVGTINGLKCNCEIIDFAGNPRYGIAFQLIQLFKKHRGGYSIRIKKPSLPPMYITDRELNELIPMDNFPNLREITTCFFRLVKTDDGTWDEGK